MTPSSRTMAWVVAAAALAAGCSSKKDTPTTTTFQESLQGGEWFNCTYEADLLHDVGEAFVFTGSTVGYRSWDYTSTNGTCQGLPAFHAAGAGTYTVGSTLTAPHPGGGPDVTAHQLDIDFGTDALYTIAWVDGAVSPDVLYIGDDSGAYDGKSPANRPIALQNKPRAFGLIDTDALDAGGGFVACRNDGGYDYREVMAFDGSRMEVRIYDHGTTNGLCGGHGVLNFADSIAGTFTSGAKVDSTLYGYPVSATQLDFTPDGSSTFYSVAWVDTWSYVPTLYVGDDESKTLGYDAAHRAITLQQLARYGLAQPAAFPAVLDGTWVYCDYDSYLGHDVRELFYFADGALHYYEYNHTTTNGSCSDNVFPSSGGSATFTTGSARTAALGSLDVTAYALDWNGLYTIVYVDTLAQPYTLYIGDDESGTLGGSPALRPTALQDYKPRYKL